MKRFEADPRQGSLVTKPGSLESAASDTPIARLAVFALVTLLVGLLLHGWDKIYDDGASDRIVVEAAWTGANPYQPHPDLYEHVGLDGGGFQGIPPRTPAVFFIQAPTLIVPVQYAGVLNITLGALAITIICLLSSRRAGMSFSWWPWLVLVSYPVLSSLRFGNIVFVYMALIVWATAGYQWWRGIPLGIAAAARLWPALIVVAFWLDGRRKAALTAFAVTVGLNLIGLALPTVTVSGAIEGLRGGEGHFGVHSFALPGPALLWPLLALALIAWIRSIDVSITVGAVAAPISWASYYLAALPTILSLRAWGPAVLIGFLSALHPWFVVIGAVWLMAESSRVSRLGRPGGVIAE